MLGAVSLPVRLEAVNQEWYGLIKIGQGDNNCEDSAGSGGVTYKYAICYG